MLVATNGSPAEAAGLSVNDEILAVDGWRLSQPFEQFESTKEVGSAHEVLYGRDGRVYSTTVVLGANPQHRFSLDSGKQTKLQECWLEKRGGR